MSGLDLDGVDALYRCIRCGWPLPEAMPDSMSVLTELGTDEARGFEVNICCPRCWHTTRFHTPAPLDRTIR